jgi:hypothetical protein
MPSGVPCGSRWDPVIAVPTAPNVNVADRPTEDAQPAGSRWAGYHARSQERSPRPLLLRACDLLGAGGGRMAVDLGCGSGTDALALLQRGWAVTAVDRDEAGLGLLGPGAMSGCRPTKAAGAKAVGPVQSKFFGRRAALHRGLPH